MGLQVGLATLAGMIEVPEVSIDENEAAAVTKAVADLAAYYDLSAPGPVGAWLSLAGTVGPIVGAHYLAYRLRMAARSAAHSTPLGAAA